MGNQNARIKNELQQRVGKLIFISNCVTPGRRFTTRPLALLWATL